MFWGFSERHHANLKIFSRDETNRVSCQELWQASLSCLSFFRFYVALVNNQIFGSLYPHSVKQHRKRKAKVLFHDVIFVIINLTKPPCFLRHRTFSCALNYSFLCFLFCENLRQTPENASQSCWFHTREHCRDKKPFYLNILHFSYQFTYLQLIGW